MTKTSSLLVAAFAATLFAAPAATAGTTFSAEPTPVSARVDDLNLSARTGAKALLRRFRNAASQACGPQPSDVRQLGYARHHRYCVQHNMEALVQATGEPVVTALFEQRRDPHLASAL